MSLTDRYRGALIGTGIGDALGAPHEGRPPGRFDSSRGYQTTYEPDRDGERRGWVTDDTQMTICLAASVSERGSIDPEDLARRFEAWMYVGRGIGHATREAIMRYVTGLPWEEAGVSSAGNGAAMRAAPIGLAFRGDMDGLRNAARLSAIVTHNDATAVASTVVMAAGVAHLVLADEGSATPQSFLEAIRVALDGVEDPPIRSRHRTGRRSLWDCIEEAAGLLSMSRRDAFAVTHNGAFVLESLPASIWAFLEHLDDPVAAVLDAVAGGYDCDTVGAMTGALAGAYHGASAFPYHLVHDLEFSDGLAGWADRLFGLSVDSPDTPPLFCSTSLSSLGWSPMEFEGLLFPTVEHAFRTRVAATAGANYVRLVPTPLNARKAGRNAVLHEDRWPNREQVIREVLREMLRQNPRHLELVYETPREDVAALSMPDTDAYGSALLELVDSI